MSSPTLRTMLLACLWLAEPAASAAPFSILQQGNLLHSRADVRQILPAYKNNLKAYWRFESNLNDTSGNSKTAVAHGTPSLSSGGHVGGSVSLNGSADYYDFGSTVMSSATTFTISLWFNQTSNALSKFWHLGVTTGCNPSSSDVGIAANGTLTATVGCGSTLSSSAVAAVGTWNHAVITKDASSNTTLYLNGVLVAGPSNINGANSLSTGNELLGARWSGGTRAEFFNGKLDEVAIWDVVLTASEVAALYQGCMAFKTTLSYTGGSQTFTVPAGCTAVSIKAWGAGGAGSGWHAGATGGGGGYARAGISTTPGENLTVIVGEKGSMSASGTYGGGGAGGAGGACCGGAGGGRSEVNRSGTVLIVAGGGAGAGSHNAGGAGGGSTGGNGSASIAPGAGVGTGGGQASAGSGGAGAASGTAGASGSSSSGGSGGNAAAGHTSPAGGGGGGYRGGGGGGGGGSGVAGAGGGGGSSYVQAGGTNTAASGATAGNSADADRGGAGNGGASSSAGSDGVVVISFP